MTSGLDLFNLDVTAINSLDDLAIDVSNGEKNSSFSQKITPMIPRKILKLCNM